MSQFEIAARDQANLLSGAASSNGATIITIPAGRVWAGSVSLNCTLTVAASGAAVSSGATVSIAGSTATPAAGVILRVWVSAPAQQAGTTAQVANNDHIPLLVIAAGTSAATLTLQTNSTSAAAATAAGVLIA